MSLPTSVPATAQEAFSRVLSTANGVKSNLTGVGNLIANGGQIFMDNLIGLYTNLNAAQATGLEIQDVTGLPAYAQTVMNDPNYDINAAFMASIVACKSVTDWLLNNMPNDGQGGFVGWRHQTDGTLQRVSVPASDLSPLATLITAALTTFA